MTAPPRDPRQDTAAAVAVIAAARRRVTTPGTLAAVRQVGDLLAAVDAAPDNPHRGDQ